MTEQPSAAGGQREARPDDALPSERAETSPPEQNLGAVQQPETEQRPGPAQQPETAQQSGPEQVFGSTPHPGPGYEPQDPAATEQPAAEVAGEAPAHSRSLRRAERPGQRAHGLDILHRHDEDVDEEAANAEHAYSPDAAGADEYLFQADGLELRSHQGAVFAPVTWSVRSDQHGAVLGEQGSGRSALLLALAGRMKGVEGTLDVGGLDGIREARKLRKEVSVARITDFAELEPLLTIAEAIDERALSEGMSLRKGRRRFTKLERALDLHFNYYDRIEYTSALNRTLLAAVLGAIRHARYTVFDDIDESLTDDQLQFVYGKLDQLGEMGHRFVVSALSTSEVPHGAAVVELPPASEDSERLALSFDHLRPRRVTRKDS